VFNQSIQSVHNPNFDCNFTFPIDWTPNGVALGAKLIGAVQLQSKFLFMQQGSERI